MAAVLEKVLAREVTPEQLLSWLKLSRQEDLLSPSLQSLENVRNDFMPYFLNYLRDQTSHLLQGCRSTSTTPAKTPTTAKLRRLTTLLVSQDVNDSSKSQSTNRLQLFSTPLDHKNKSLDKTSFLSESSLSKTGSAPRKQSRNKSRDGSGKSQRSIQFTDSQNKAKHKTSLGDFMKSPDNDGRSRRTPHGSKWENVATVPSVNKRSGGKSKGGHSNDRKQRLSNSQPEIKAPTFSDINEFPPMGEDRGSSLPEGMKVITPSRRITPTRLVTATKDDNKLFKNAPVLAEPPKPLSIWGKMANRDNSNQDNKANSNIARSQPSRRITPTLLPGPAAEDNSIFSLSPIVSSQTQNIKPVKPNLKDSTTSDETITSGERSIRTQESVTEGTTPMKTKSQCLDVSLSAITPTKLACEQQMSLDVTPADVNMVTNTQSLDILASLYALCINAFLVPNLAVELYFLIQILTARGGEMDTLPDISNDLEELLYCSTIHNAVYFSIMVLSHATSILGHLDRGTLRLLMDNQRINDFRPDFRDELCRLYSLAPSKSLPKSLPSPIGGVSFQADTDNRKNFPSERCFHLFKKQRDSFYELLREWEDHHLNPGWSMLDAQGERIERVVGYRTELANHLHFVRLFQSQLVQMCKGDSSWQKNEEDENIALLSELRQTNPKKLKQLRERLVTPALRGGPCPAPSFPGCQEFFRDFISAACNPLFRQHLSDLLLHKISEMDQVQLISVEVTYEEDQEIMIDAEDKETLLNCLLTSKLLAKFLGHLSFLPYSTPEVLPESLQATYIAIRNKSCPPVDVMGCIERSRLERRTVITIPWVVDYLSMMDSSSNQTDYFQRVFALLLRIYRETSEAFLKKQMPSQILVLAILGWLFELPCFPEGLIFSDAPLVTYEEGSRLAVDNLNIVDQQILYSCCPYLGEVRSLLVDFAVGLSGRGNSIRKITPMSADVVKDVYPATVSDKQLQHQLEDNFFHNHPASLKKTVEFVADRVSSNHIKVYRTQALPQVLDEARQHVEVIAREIVQKQTESTTLGQKEIQESVEKRATELANKGKLLGLESAPKYCSEKCCSILSLMLPEETPPQVWQAAALISYRQTLDKVNKWLNMHITTHMFKKELLVTTDLEKQVRDLSKRNQEAATELPSGGVSGTTPSSHDLSDGTPGHKNTEGAPRFNAPGGTTDTHNTPVTVGTTRKSFMFESPVRALQNAALKPKVHLEESPIRFVLQSTLVSTQKPASPSSKCIQNLSSFDKEPADFSIGGRILSLSKFGQDVSAVHDGRIVSGETMGMEDVDHLLKSLPCGKMVDKNLDNSDVNESCNSCKMAQPFELSFQPQIDGLVINMKTASINKPDGTSAQRINTETVSAKTDKSLSAVEFEACPKCGLDSSERFSSSSGLTKCSCFREGRTSSSVITLATGTNVEQPDKSTICDVYSIEMDNVESGANVDDLSSTTSILSRSGLGGKKLNVSFHEQTEVCSGLDAVSFRHSTPNSSPTKAAKSRNTQHISPTKTGNSRNILNLSPTKAVKSCSSTPHSSTSNDKSHNIMNNSPTKPAKLNRILCISPTVASSSDIADGMQVALETVNDVSDFVSPTEPLIALKECVRCIIQDPDTLNPTLICDVLQAVIQTLTRGHKDVVVLVTKMIGKLSVELAFALSLRLPDLLTTEVRQTLFSLWTLDDIEKCVDFSPTLCAKHAQLLRQGNKTYSNLLKVLLERRLLQLPTLVANARRLMNNSYVEADVSCLIAQLLCDVLPMLPINLLSSDTLHSLLQTLAQSEPDKQREDTLNKLIKQIRAPEVSQLEAKVEGLPIKLGTISEEHKMPNNSTCDQHSGLLTGTSAHLLGQFCHVIGPECHMIKETRHLIGQHGDMNDRQCCGNNNVCNNTKEDVAQ